MQPNLDRLQLHEPHQFQFTHELDAVVANAQYPQFDEQAQIPLDDARIVACAGVHLDLFDAAPSCLQLSGRFDDEDFGLAYGWDGC